MHTTNYVLFIPEKAADCKKKAEPIGGPHRPPLWVRHWIEWCHCLYNTSLDQRPLSLALSLSLSRIIPVRRTCCVIYSQLQAAKRFLSAVPLTWRLDMALRSQLRYSSVRTGLMSRSLIRLSRKSTCVSRSNMLKKTVSSADNTSRFIRRSSFFTCRISDRVSASSCWIYATASRLNPSNAACPKLITVKRFYSPNWKNKRPPNNKTIPINTNNKILLYCLLRIIVIIINKNT